MGSTCRRFAYVMALVAMLAQVGSYAHLATSAHVTCEHGELVEAGHVPATTARLAALASFDRPAEARIGVALASGHGHEHCAASPHRRDRAGHELPRAVRVAAAPIVATLAPALVVRTASIDLIRLAPKSSPPRV